LTEDDKAKLCKVVRQTLWNWRKDKDFTNAVNARAKELFGSERPRWFAALSLEACTGDVQALRLCYQLTGDLSHDGTTVNVNQEPLIIIDRDEPEDEVEEDLERADIIKDLERGRQGRNGSS